MIDLKNIDKSSWETHKFEEIANKITENVDPAKTNLEVYVGLEHLDTEDIHIKRYGKPSEVKGGKLRCYPGDVIFGKRRAYQRKAALVDFDGICSAHAFIFRANPEIIDPKLFPFFLHSDQFMHRMVDISVGGLSPTINWSDLRHQEFLLPPKDQQARLAELLWAMDNVIEKEREVLEKIKTVFEIKLKKHFEFSKSLEGLKNRDLISTEIGWMPSNYELVPQGKVAEFINGRAYKKDEWEDSGIPVIRLQNLTGTSEKYYYSNLKLPEKNYCYSGDLLYMWSATFGATIWEGEKAIFHYHIWKIKCKQEKIRQQFMYYNLEDITKRMMRQVSGSTMPHITKSGMENLKIGLPPLKVQDEIIEELDKITNSINFMKSKTNTSKALQKKLINQIF